MAVDGYVYHVMIVLDTNGTLIGTCAESDQGELEPGGPFRCRAETHPGGWSLIGYRSYLRD